MQKSNELFSELTKELFSSRYFNVYQYLDTGRFLMILFKNNIKMFELTMN